MQPDKLFSPKEFGTAVGVSESSVKRWVDNGKIEATKTPGGHRRISFAAAVQFIRKEQLQVVRPDIISLRCLLTEDSLPKDGPLSADEILSSAQVARHVSTTTRGGEDDSDARFLDSLLRGERDIACGLIWGRYLEGTGLAELIDGPICTAMMRIGTLWHDGPQGIAVEHRATEICTYLLNQLRASIETPVGAPVAVGGSAPGDSGALASLACATVMASEGYESVNLGGNLPIEALRVAIEEHTPRIVWLSCSHVDPTANGIMQDIYSLGIQLASRGQHFVIGGRAIAHSSLNGDSPIRQANKLGDLAQLARSVHTP